MAFIDRFLEGDPSLERREELPWTRATTMLVVAMPALIIGAALAAPEQWLLFAGLIWLFGIGLCFIDTLQVDARTLPRQILWWALATPIGYLAMRSFELQSKGVVSPWRPFWWTLGSTIAGFAIAFVVPPL